MWEEEKLPGRGCHREQVGGCRRPRWLLHTRSQSQRTTVGGRASSSLCGSDKLSPADPCTPKALLVITRPCGLDSGVWEAVPGGICVCLAGSPGSGHPGPRARWAEVTQSVCCTGHARRGMAGGAVPGGGCQVGGARQGCARRGCARQGCQAGRARRGSGTWQRTQLRECLAIKNNWAAGRAPLRQEPGGPGPLLRPPRRRPCAPYGAGNYGDHGEGGRQRRPGRDVRLV